MLKGVFTLDYNSIIPHFSIDGEVLITEPHGEGHIHDTYLITTAEARYVFQRINHHVFKSPENIMENITAITSYLRKKIIERGGDPTRETLNLIPTKDGKSFYKSEDGNYYRMYAFIYGAQSHQTVKEPIHFYNAARAFGLFQKQLADFPANTLFESIVNFHNTRVRFENFISAVEEDKMNRAKDVTAEIEFAKARGGEAGTVIDLIEAGEIPLRVTHNDTKYDNIMIDDKTGEGICVIDLDTVMPGSLLYDYGDSLRFGTNPAAEDEKDLSKVYMSEELFEMFTKGFLEEMRDSLTPAEIHILPFSAKLMTYECGIRFLTDYLDGDNYFKTEYPGQNLDRARTQFKLVADMENKMDFMAKTVKKYL